MNTTILIGAMLGLLPLLAQAQTSPMTVIAAQVGFPEGPYMLGNTLLFAEYGSNRVSAWDGTALSVLWEKDGCGPSAVAPLGDDLVVTCYDNATVARISRSGADIATYSTDNEGEPLLGPNDFSPDSAGGVWMTASGPWESGPIVGKVYHLAPDGALRMVANDLHYANGVAQSPEGGRLFVNESEAGRVISFAIDADGELSDRRLALRVFMTDPKSGVGAYPDGIKFGPDGNLWIGQYSSGRIVVATPEGEFVRAIDVPTAAAPNFTFSADGKTIYVMAVDDTSAAPYTGRVLAMPLK
jgi:sugar lactone lactonase YvrE